MRYMIITYIRRANGQIDEQVGFAKRLKQDDLQTANVIMDYTEQKVVKCVIENKVVPTDFDRLNEYYAKIYPELIAQLNEMAKQNGK
jgi:hypothetical protein